MKKKELKASVKVVRERVKEEEVGPGCPRAPLWHMAQNASHYFLENFAKGIKLP